MSSFYIGYRNLQIINTWETIISIFKGLNKLLNHELLLSYERAITKATQHSNSCIRSLAWSIFEVKNDFNNISKQILNEIEKCLEKRTFNPKSGSIMKKKEETEKEICIPNKKSANSKLVPNKPNDKKKSIMPEPDSQVHNIYYFYVMLYIRTFGNIVYICNFFIGLCIHKNGFEI